MEKYWRSLEEYKNGPEKNVKKLVEEGQKNLVLDLADEKLGATHSSRRDFLKLVGFSFATAAITSSCEKPIQKAIPYLIKPEEITPGKASYYASSFFDGTEYCSVLVKVRDGRPIKIEANKMSPVSLGGTSARVQASVLELYDQARLQEPTRSAKSITWEALDAELINKLEERTAGRKVILTSTIISPSTIQLIKDLQKKYPKLEWIIYDETPASGIRNAHEKLVGKRVIPGYHFDKADYILSFEGDFLGTWLSPVEFSRMYVSKRDVSKEHPEMSKHIHFESSYSITGSNADERYPMSPGKWKSVLAKIFNEIAKATSSPELISGVRCDFDTSAIVNGLLANKAASIVISGSNDTEIQLMVAGINKMLGNYGSTLDLTSTLNIKKGSDKEFIRLKKSLLNKDVSLLIMANVNPVFSSVNGAKLGEAIQSVDLSVYIGSSFSETAKLSSIIAPDHHYLEAWGDAEPVKGQFSLQQPTIHPLYNTRSFQDSLLKWTGRDTDYYSYLLQFWEEKIYPLSNRTKGFKQWWNESLQNGVFTGKLTKPSTKNVTQLSGIPYTAKEDRGMVLTLYSSVGIMDGRHANNPWLQELPDPITKVCWDNYLSVSLEDALELELEDEDMVSLMDLEVPVLIQPGQARGTCSLALGYGRTVAGKVGDNVGVNAYSLIDESESYRNYTIGGVTITKLGKKYELARTQTHHTMDERPVVRETSLKAYKKDPSAGNHFHLEAEAHHDTMYPQKKYDAYHWGLAVDLNKCTGCNNCIVACTAENNVVTVGKEEVKNRRIMHWLRIDRYFSENAENPKTYHQPVMCQHCDNAPCENVCPVSATNHSSEGLNQIAYNRCIGTKYCINNCPYRVRRFNWFKYVNNDNFNFHLNEETGKMVLNPDVTVRSRGVVEKCTFCVQRIQEKKLTAKLENRSVADGEIQTACVQSCPTGALIFGNLADKDSEVSKSKADERNYHLLEQLHTLPSVGYLTKVRNVEEEGGENKEHNPEPHG